MLDVDCSGLWVNWGGGVVYKSPILEDGRYWIGPDMPGWMRQVLEEDVMPTLGRWMGLSWTEIDERPSSRFLALIWRYTGPGEYECAPGHYTWMGCGHHRSGEIELREATTYGARPPRAYLRETAIHEALHILYGASHAERGIMCVEWDTLPGCSLRQERSGGTVWHYRLDSLDEATYSLYAHPAIEDGMSLEQVRGLFGW